MIEESNYCTDNMKKHYDKEPITAKKDNEDFRNSKCWICNIAYIDHFHVTGKCRDSAHRECNINVKLNHRIPVVFHNL